jgi:hypothetical protein
LGISTLRDRVCMTAAMPVLEPVFEADLPPEQYAYRPGRNAQQAVVEVEALLFRGRPDVVDADLADYLSPIRDTYSEGFSYFVTSIAAPVGSGSSVRRVGLAPTGKRRLATAHTQSSPREPRLQIASLARGSRQGTRYPANPSFGEQVVCGIAQILIWNVAG